MRPIAFLAPTVLTAALIFAPARAEIVANTPTSFTVSDSIPVAASPARVYDALVDVAAWWDPEHSWSGDSHNLTLDARPGGCFCEALQGGGGVEHGFVIDAAPGSILRLNAALGPLHDMPVIGILTWSFQPAGTGTLARVTYEVGGATEGGLASLAAPVDRVIGSQLHRLATYVETGAPAN